MRRRAVLVFIAIVTACVSDDAPHAGVVRTDSAGVTIVRHASLDSSVVWTLSEEPILRIGEADGEEPYLLSWGYAQRLGDGAIAVVETRDREIRIFDSAGKYLNTIGGQGAGPGEFRYLNLVDVMPGDSILAWDGNQRRMTIFDRQGRVGRIFSISPEIPPGIDVWTVTGTFRDGSVLLYLYHIYHDVPGTIHDGRYTLARWTANDLDRIHPFVDVSVRNLYNLRDSEVCSVPFAPGPRYTTSADRLYLTPGDRFTFTGYALDGRQVLRVTVDHEPVPVTEGARSTYERQRLASALPARREVVRHCLDEVPFAEEMPVLDEIMVASDENVWVRMYATEDSAPRHWHVFDRDGDHLAFVEIPAELPVVEIHGNVLISRWIDELGVPSVRVYAIRRS